LKIKDYKQFSIFNLHSSILMKPNRVSDLISEVISKSGIKRGMRRAEAVILWPHVVGPEVSKFSQAKSLQDGILYVEVPDSETSMHLMIQRQKFLDIYRSKFKVLEIQDIRFRVGRPKVVEDNRKTKAIPIHVDPRALAQLTKPLSDLPETIAQPTMQTARSLLAYRERKLAEGWQACTLCGAISENSLCEACTRYKEEPKVIKSAETLMQNPSHITPFLSDEERTVAIDLAKEKLKDKMAELLPFVLSDPRYKPELEQCSRIYVALQKGKALSNISDEDLDILDGKVARALGRWK
jgi:hypothetical protein